MIFTTILQAIDPMDGELKTWGGPHIAAQTWEAAEAYLQKNGLGYLKIDGALIEERTAFLEPELWN